MLETNSKDIDQLVDWVLAYMDELMPVSASPAYSMFVPVTIPLGSSMHERVEIYIRGHFSLSCDVENESLDEMAKAIAQELAQSMAPC